MSKDTIIDSENFVNIVSRQKKFELKTAILQLNNLYFRNCCTLISIKLSV